MLSLLRLRIPELTSACSQLGPWLLSLPPKLEEKPLDSLAGLRCSRQPSALASTRLIATVHDAKRAQELG